MVLDCYNRSKQNAIYHAGSSILESSCFTLLDNVSDKPLQIEEQHIHLIGGLKDLCIMIGFQAGNKDWEKEAFKSVEGKGNAFAVLEVLLENAQGSLPEYSTAQITTVMREYRDALIKIEKNKEIPSRKDVQGLIDFLSKYTVFSSTRAESIRHDD